jgi:hypothetical protein
MVSISCGRACTLLHARLWKEQVVNILEAIRGEFGKKHIQQDVKIIINMCANKP